MCLFLILCALKCFTLLSFAWIFVGFRPVIVRKEDVIAPNEILLQNFLTVNVTENKQTLSNLIIYPTPTRSSSTTTVISSTKISSESTKSLDLNRSISEDLSWLVNSSKIDQLNQTDHAEDIAHRFGDIKTTAFTEKSDSIIFDDANNASLQLSLKSLDQDQNESEEEMEGSSSSVSNFPLNSNSTFTTSTPTTISTTTVTTATSTTTTIRTTTTSTSTTTSTTTLSSTTIATTTTSSSISTITTKSSVSEDLTNLQLEILTGLFNNISHFCID